MRRASSLLLAAALYAAGAYAREVGEPLRINMPWLDDPEIKNGVGDKADARAADIDFAPPAVKAKPVRAEEKAIPEMVIKEKPRVSGEKYNYGHVMGLSLLFLEAQRSGKMPKNNRIAWRGDSALKDGSDVGLDLTGGWYDAGDHVKFNYPMTFTVSSIAWGGDEYWDAWQSAGEERNLLDSLKWVTDYIIKCHPDKNTYYVQIGNGDSDHNFWGTAEAMTMSRPSYAIGKNSPGSDAIGEAAAALAATSILFRKHGDDAYAKKLIITAESLFDLAYTYQGKFSPFYSSSDFHDELAWAATWLYKATDNKDYLKKAEDLFDNCCTNSWAYSWDSKAPGVQVLLWQLTGKDKYARAAKGFVNSAMGQRATPKGLAYWDQWGSNRYAANAAFIVLAAADQEAKHGKDLDFVLKARQWALKQINYMLGDAFGGLDAKTGLPKYSFVCGYGIDFPKAPHHRGASCKAGTDCSCGSNPEPHILYGALVGGPGEWDDYSDSCSDYTKNEVTTDYNAGFTSALAALRHLTLTKQLPDKY